MKRYQTFKGVNTFEYDIEVTKGPVTIQNHLNTIQINNVILRHLYEQVIRRGSTKRIRGVKTFESGLNTEYLKVYGTDQNCLHLYHTFELRLRMDH
jgi:hypothetical protein